MGRTQSDVHGHNHAQVFAAIADAVADGTALVHRDRRYDYRALAERVRRVANLLLAHGITVHGSPGGLAPCESGHDHVWLMLLNGNEYMEASLGAAATRAASFNINYRYVGDELAYVLNDANAAATCATPRSHRSLVRCFIACIASPCSSKSQTAAMVRCSTVPSTTSIRSGRRRRRHRTPSSAPTTHGPLFEATIALGLPEPVEETTSVTSLVDGIRASEATVLMPLCPLVHGAAHWLALVGLLSGARVVFPDVVDGFDAADALRTIAREGVRAINIIGDAFARPLCDELKRSVVRPPSLEMIVNGGAALSARSRRRRLAALPAVTLVDGAGLSESGIHLSTMGGSADEEPRVHAKRRTPVPSTRRSRGFSSQDMTASAGSRGASPFRGATWGTPQRTARTFRMIDGRRMVVPGDRAWLRGDGLVELVGRDTATINAGARRCSPRRRSRPFSPTKGSPTWSSSARRPTGRERRSSPSCKA